MYLQIILQNIGLRIINRHRYSNERYGKNTLGVGTGRISKIENKKVTKQSIISGV